ncbi:MAG: hypothetical protein IJ418_12190 [Clostridia bacterium]|nr:hypothetical protein [Clostridia bacterium]
MIVIENLTINGRAFVRTYSDGGFLVERDGIRYAEAIDPAGLGRTYVETDQKANSDELDEGLQTDDQAVLEEIGCSFDG